MKDDRPAPYPADPWAYLRDLTPARVALGRTGASLPTREILRFGHAHALARDAVHASLEIEPLVEALRPLGATPIMVGSAAADRATYLRRPDLGRRLSVESRERLGALDATPSDVAVVIGDGLSATAILANVPSLLAALWPALARHGWRLTPIVVATQARVALGDEIGALLKARLVLMLVGERPGLSSPDSLGAYLTFAPEPGRRDHERNCVSNIREAGLAPTRAAAKLLWLIEQALGRGLTGIALKDESGDDLTLGLAAAPLLP